MSEISPMAGAAERFRFHGRLGDLYGIWLANLLLKGLTLGIYHFWGKTRLRRYLWSQTGFEGERFQYTGTGRELMVGYVKAMVLLIPLLLLLDAAATAAVKLPALSTLLGALSYLAFFGFGGLARYSSRRYRLTRTRWRSIRFAMSGSAVAYGLRTLGHALLAAVTLGLTFPVLRNDLVRYQVAHTSFGTARLDYIGRGRELYRHFLWRWALSLALVAALPLALVVLGSLPAAPEAVPAGLALLIVAIGLALVALWLSYLGVEWRHFADCTRLRGMRFALAISPAWVAWLYLSSFVAIVLTVGLAYPWVVARTLRFICRHLAATGELDYAAVAQGAGEAPATGEGLMDALDLGDIGI